MKYVPFHSDNKKHRAGFVKMVARVSKVIEKEKGPEGLIVPEEVIKLLKSRAAVNSILKYHAPKK